MHVVFTQQQRTLFNLCDVLSERVKHVNLLAFSIERIRIITQFR